MELKFKKLAIVLNTDPRLSFTNKFGASYGTGMLWSGDFIAQQLYRTKLGHRSTVSL